MRMVGQAEAGCLRRIGQAEAAVAEVKAAAVAVVEVKATVW